MSKKPLKHSEAKRAKKSAAARMKEGWGAQRAVPLMHIKPARHLIVTEGTKTEPFYFGEIGRRVNSNFHGRYVSVDVAGLGMNTVSLFEHACRLAEESVAGYTHVWVVYDCDSFPTGNFNSVVDLCATEHAGGATFHAIWTNEAFELWYILHFEYLQASLSRKDYEPKLSSYLVQRNLGKYKKKRRDMFNILEPMLPEAIANAERLKKRNVGKTPAKSAPGTKMHVLMKELIPYIDSL